MLLSFEDLFEWNWHLLSVTHYKTRGRVYAPGRKNFENTSPAEKFSQNDPFGGATQRNSKINANLTEFSINLINFRLI